MTAPTEDQRPGPSYFLSFPVFFPFRFSFPSLSFLLSFPFLVISFRVVSRLHKALLFSLPNYIMTPPMSPNMLTLCQTNV